MSFPYFTGESDKTRKDGEIEWPPASRRQKLEDPSGYIVDRDLEDAVNVAIHLSQPLLLTGEPGTGKTLLAYAAGKRLGLETHKFETKSTSVARDLFYIYDTVGRFHAAQTGQTNKTSFDFITFSALGKAILRTYPKKEISKWITDTFKQNGDEWIENSLGKDGEWPCRSIVLIDEVDKAPRDFPNDILNEIEGMYFKVPELDNQEFRAKMRPLVIITSNSEKHLPDAFLRRCIFYNILFPNRDRMIDIVKKRVGKYVENSEDFMNKALDLFIELRKPTTGLHKKPATAELLGWIIALKDGNKDNPNPISKHNEENLRRSLTVLIKTSDDIEQAEKALTRWLKTK